jgi:F-type H+-transporting ATPase subunit delta
LARDYFGFFKKYDKNNDLYKTEGILSMSFIMTSKIVRKYAKSFFDLMKDRSDIEQILKTVASLHTITAQSADFRAFLKTPLLKNAEKKEIIKEISISLNADQYIINFLYLLIANHRISLLDKILDSILAFFKSADGNLVAQVYAPIGLTEEQSLKIKQKISDLLKRKVEIEVTNSTDFLGGLIIQVGPQFLDASLKNDLDALNKEMKGF